MRYENLTAFKRHLIESSPDHLSPCYLILIEDERQRKTVLKEVASFFKPQFLQIQENRTLQGLIEDLSSRTFLEEKDPLVVADYEAFFQKKERDTLHKFLVSLPSCKFILGVSSKASLGSLYSWFETKGVILEMNPKQAFASWQEWIQKRAWEEKKKFVPESFVFLMKGGKRTFSFWETYLEKLFCYLGEKEKIEIEDIKKTLPKEESSLWHITAKAIWDQKIETEVLHMEDSSFFPLLTLFRKELRIGWKMALFLQNGISHLAPHFPGIWPKILEEKKQKAEALGSSYFKKGLTLLFDIEYLAKDGITDYSSLMTVFIGKLHDLASSSQPA